VGPATKSVIRLGVVGTFSGPVGGLVKDTVTGIRVWGQYINANGGVNGHPVEILVGDDGGDPARYISLQQQFAEQKGAIAFLYGTLGFSPNGNNKYLDSKHIFTFGTEGGLDTVYNDPYVLTATPAGHTNADSILLALGDVARPLHKVKFAEFACSDFGLCDNFDNRWSNPSALKQVGFQLVARGRPSLTQPDYTSQCLAAKQGGAEVVMLALDTASLRRFAGSCARQNYHPIFGTADLLASNSLPVDPNVDGLIVATKMAPWTDPSVAGIAEVTKAFATYAPGPLPTGGNTNGWILGQFFAAAGKNLPDRPTAADVADGLYQIKNDNLQGMTFPITMTRGQTMPKQLCYGVVVIKDRKYSKFPGKALRCSPSLAADSTPSSTTTNAQAPSAALPASFSAGGMRGMSRPSLPRPAAPATDCGPGRATGFSYLLDAFQTGAGAGPGVFEGLLASIAGQAAPEPIGSFQQAFLAQSGAFAERAAKDGPAFLQGARTYFEPFGVYNDYGNAFVDAFANSTDAFATQTGPSIQPGDTSMHQFADAARQAKADSSGCTPTVDQSVATTPAGLIGVALAKGDKNGAIALLTKYNLVADAKTLGDIVFLGGIAAANANTGQTFADTVAYVFPQAGISVANASSAFQAAATRATQEGLTFEQGAIGFRTVTETYAAYFHKGF
jgi:ABC-type branched-subunit amino acid transport system substrate-binding protein